MRVTKTEVRYIPGLPRILAKAWEEIPQRMTLKAMCKQAGITPGFWYQITGKDARAKGISWEKLQGLCKVLGLDFDAVINRAVETQPDGQN